MKIFTSSKALLLVFSFVCGLLLPCEGTAAHPNLVITQQDIVNMRAATQQQGRFKEAYDKLKKAVDSHLQQPITVPIPVDGGGGYTHEKHKKNYQLMYNAAIVYQLSEDPRYAEYVRDMLLKYAGLYPTLPLHPARKENAQNPGKFFWQSLNEAVWLVHTIQAYDLIYNHLSETEINKIESNLLKPVSLFLSEGQPSTFDKIHNHGTWATAGVGMAGYVMNEPEWVEKALYGLDKSGTGGFLKQLDKLFSPQGYYNEGPYYQRYALMPFVTFGRAIENNEPDRAIFKHRDGVLLKAIDTTIQLSYNGLFFPINDAIKSKGIDTVELVHGVAIAYGLTGEPGYLDIAKQQGQIVMSGDGLRVAKALDAGLAKPYPFKSVAFGDGSDGQQGALVIMRSEQHGNQALLFKPAAQGLGHGHFDKLTWQFYDMGNEIVSDYGAARFLNVEAKFGGRYLPENNSYAKQTIAHNTVVVDETSHFQGNVKTGNKHAPTLHFFETSDFGVVSSGSIDTAYDGVVLKRTLALVELDEKDSALALDIFNITADTPRQLDLPLHYKGQLIDTTFPVQAHTDTLKPLGTENGYQHLWLKGEGQPSSGLAKITWLNGNGRFYTQSFLTNGNEHVLFTHLGANDPNFNLTDEHAFIRRVEGTASYQFVSVLEPHGEYNPGKEYTLRASSQIEGLQMIPHPALTLVSLTHAGHRYLVAINPAESEKSLKEINFNYENQSFELNGRMAVFKLNDR